MAATNEKTTMNLQQESTHSFTWKGKSFADEKNFENSLRFDDNGNSCANKDFLQFVTIRPGLHIVIYRVDPVIMPRYDFDMEDNPVGFGFLLSGKMECTQDRGQGKKSVSTLHQRGDNSLFFPYGTKGHSQYLSREILNAVIIYIDREMFADLIAEELGEISTDCRHLLRQHRPSCSRPMTEKMFTVAASAFYQPYHGAVSRLHLEACGLELLSLQIASLTRQDICREKVLCRIDEERIRMAGDILVRHMVNPPTISALALQVGVNSAKLKRGFKQIFGTTIGQFLLQHRMACARKLLLSREADVTQAAFSVGYANVSHFIRNYKKTFGVTPGNDKQTRRSRILLSGIK